MCRVYASLVVACFLTATAFAAGSIPAVNVDMGCGSSGEGVYYNGSMLACGAPTRPTTTIGSLPACNSGAQGKMYFVTDALLPVALAAVGAGGAVKIGVTCNSVSWIVQ